MKLVYFSFLIILCGFCAACGEQEPDCLQSDFVDSYLGTMECVGTAAEEVTVTITAEGTNAVNFAYEAPSGTGSFTDAFTVESCDLERVLTDSGFTSTVRISLEGDKLSYSEVILDALGVELSNCTILASRI